MYIVIHLSLLFCYHRCDHFIRASTPFGLHAHIICHRFHVRHTRSSIGSHAWVLLPLYSVGCVCTAATCLAAASALYCTAGTATGVALLSWFTQHITHILYTALLVLPWVWHFYHGLHSTLPTFFILHCWYCHGCGTFIMV